MLRAWRNMLWPRLHHKKWGEKGFATVKATELLASLDVACDYPEIPVC